mmetsp:Transcript_33433/g.81309  ORF Transcript_33433/g.81309 Transcript_33433/m.81309 type:complete len:256 (+) Transcript_33433:588-1355(+)
MSHFRPTDRYARLYPLHRRRAAPKSHPLRGCPYCTTPAAANQDSNKVQLACLLWLSSGPARARPPTACLATAPAGSAEHRAASASALPRPDGRRAAWPTGCRRRAVRHAAWAVGRQTSATSTSRGALAALAPCRRRLWRRVRRPAALRVVRMAAQEGSIWEWCRRRSRRHTWTACPRCSARPATPRTRHSHSQPSLIEAEAPTGTFGAARTNAAPPSGTRRARAGRPKGREPAALSRAGRSTCADQAAQRMARHL